VRHNLFWKLGFAFLALLLGVLLAVDYFAERALRRDYERTGFEQLAAIAHIARHNFPIRPTRRRIRESSASGPRRWPRAGRA